MLRVFRAVTEDTGEVDIDGPGSSDYDQQSEPNTSGSSDSEGRRMAPISVLSRPGLLAGHLLPTT